MTEDDLIWCLYWVAYNLKDPTYNPLDVGVRHSPLTQSEKLERYEHECHCIRLDILTLIEKIKKDGINNE